MLQMNLKLYLVVKCTNEGVDSAQAFANEKAAKEFFKDEVDSEITIATDGGYFNYAGCSDDFVVGGNCVSGG